MLLLIVLFAFAPSTAIWWDKFCEDAPYTAGTRVAPRQWEAGQQLTDLGVDTSQLLISPNAACRNWDNYVAFKLGNTS